ncbi:MAG: hypothetical protein A3B37_00415 [Candidatus Sungbacteria bacterium RIFCSPLOWO2_01_FULL_59_16]|uniref:Alpha/beta hydrolase n=1 Tax=Candidatus Sungbacteria bacterium RIFCSPLOWO2_01_FULL_59_16 TaxID=1802280 RepID=A0A1G2LD94_9BACT|nr:MAG: hypothetical protein A3B37_00415 [Candidatus Sungbacteria bacterium RIFCSPLOWO2_01_FULL_59_16]
MSKRVFIVHGWDGDPEEGWFPWLKRELEVREFQVTVPAMPESSAPKIEQWVAHLSRVVGESDEHTYLVGHSIGCQTILRYLETLPEEAKVGGVILVAGWMTLTPAATPTATDRDLAKPWLETPLDWKRVKERGGHFAAILSDNDPYVPMENAELFREKLGAEVVVEHAKGHFSGSDGVAELPSALSTILKCAKAN